VGSEYGRNHGPHRLALLATRKLPSYLLQSMLGPINSLLLSEATLPPQAANEDVNKGDEIRIIPLRHAMIA
jgi:hypothetical protein